MGEFCPKMTSKSDILTLFSRGFEGLTIRLNMLEGRITKIPNVFYSVPYPSLGKPGIRMPFWSILEVFLALLAKWSILADFQTFLAKSAQFHQMS